MRLDRFRALAGAALAAVLATGLLAACGSDDDAQTLTFKATAKGITGPSSADTGSAEITFDNSGKKDVDLQLIRIEGNHSADEVAKAFASAGESAPFRDWFFAGGGVGTTKGGQSQTVTEVLEPGTYYALSTNGPDPQPADLSPIKVTGDPSDEELEADAEVQAIDYGFKATGLKSGENEILFANTGAQPHHILASKAIGDATAADAEKFFTSPPGQGGKPPLSQKGTQNTAVVEGGESQLVTLDLKPGKYILYCFVSDRQGGPPHALKGMVDEVDVK